VQKGVVIIKTIRHDLVAAAGCRRSMGRLALSSKS